MMTIVMPQRLDAPAPIGSLFKRGSARQLRGGGRGPLPDLSHLAAVRELPCLKCGLEPAGEAHHVRLRHFTMGKRPSDSQTIPLCTSCHRHDRDSLHAVGEAMFWQGLDLNPLTIAVALYSISPDITRMRAVVFSFIALRP